MSVTEALARALQYQTPARLKRPRPAPLSVPATIARTPPRVPVPLLYSAHRHLTPLPLPAAFSPSDSEEEEEEEEEEESESEDDEEESESESEEDCDEEEYEEESTEGSSTDSTVLMPKKRQNKRRSAARAEVIVLDSDSEDEGSSVADDASETWATTDESQAFEGVTVLGSDPVAGTKEEEPEEEDEEEEDLRAALYRDEEDEEADRCEALAARQRALEEQEAREIEGVRRSLARVSLAAPPSSTEAQQGAGGEEEPEESSDSTGLGTTAAERMQRWRVGPLAASEMACVENALRRRRGERTSRVFATLGDASVTHRDVQCLRPAEWLNDEVVNFFGALLNDRDRRWHLPVGQHDENNSNNSNGGNSSATTTLPHCHVMSTFFYTALTTQRRYNYPGCASGQRVWTCFATTRCWCR